MIYKALFGPWSENDEEFQKLHRSIYLNLQHLRGLDTTPSFLSICIFYLCLSVLRETDIYASSHPQLLKNWNAALSRSSCGGLTFWNSLASIELAISSSDRGMLFVPGKRIQNQQHPAVRYIPFTFQYKFRNFFKNTLFPHLAKMYCLMKCPGQFPRSPLFSSHQGPISNQQVNLI